MTALTTAIPSNRTASSIGEFVVPAAVLAIIVALIAPMPPFLLDLLLVMDIMVSVIVLMVSMYITKPVEFNVFPTALLLLTLFRLALNISSTRLILIQGNAGLIDESEARMRRKNLALEAEFYGAMDGATRFTQRDAVASILITTINIVAGFLIGVFQHGMDLNHALATYTVLTIGDGLVTVIPALMVSVCGGLIVTRATSDNQLGSEMRKQIFSNPQPLLLSGGVLVALAAFPGLPTVPFLLLGSGVGYAGWRMRQKALATESAEPAILPRAAKENLDSVFKVEPLAVE